MSRRFIATIAIAALTITAIGNAPARADEDLARVLATIVGVAIVGKVISDKLDDDDDNKVSRRYNDRVAQVQPITPRGDGVIRQVQPRSLPRGVKRRLLPGDCLRSFRTPDGRQHIFGEKCLKKNYRFSKNLPRVCKVKFRVNGKKRHGYGARCLRRAGYQLARR